jgi:hypothetical protein
MQGENKPKGFSLDLEHVLNLIAEANEQISVLKDLFVYFTEENSVNYNEYFALPIVCELMWYNYSILRSLTLEQQEAVFLDSDHPNKKQIVILENTILLLRTLLLSRHQATRELNKVSYSTSLH